MLKGFLNFVREQGVVGLAVGFLLGGSVSKMVTALVTDIINPLLTPAMGAAGNFREATLSIGSVHLLWGDFVANLIDFSVIAAIVYFGVRGLGLDKIDKPKAKKKAK
jgi:large conductance mechanosensitive channel